MLAAGGSLKEHDAAEAFAPPQLALAAQTVHSFKGEDSDAVMIVVRPHHASDPTSQLALWEAAISGRNIESKKEEERRVLFVALTRAARYCLVALPNDARGRAVAETCSDLGLVLIDAS
jgi:superfamily I DNA/RNA helicase